MDSGKEEGRKKGRRGLIEVGVMVGETLLGDGCVTLEGVFVVPTRTYSLESKLTEFLYRE